MREAMRSDLLALSMRFPCRMITMPKMCDDCGEAYTRLYQTTGEHWTCPRCVEQIEEEQIS